MTALPDIVLWIAAGSILIGGVFLLRTFLRFFWRFLRKILILVIILLVAGYFLGFFDLIF